MLKCLICVLFYQVRFFFSLQKKVEPYLLPPLKARRLYEGVGVGGVTFLCKNLIKKVYNFGLNLFDILGG